MYSPPTCGLFRYLLVVSALLGRIAYMLDLFRIHFDPLPILCKVYVLHVLDPYAGSKINANEKRNQYAANDNKINLHPLTSCRYNI